MDKIQVQYLMKIHFVHELSSFQIWFKRNNKKALQGLQMQYNIFLQFQESIQNLISFDEKFIMSIRQSNSLIEEHMQTLLSQQKFIVEKTKNKISFQDIKNFQTNCYDQKTKMRENFHQSEEQKVQQLSKSDLIIERKQSRQSQKQQKTKSKLLAFIVQRRIVEIFFTTRFSELFQFDKGQESRVYKKEFRDIFIKWLIEKEIITKNRSDLTGDDLMLLQRVLTNYIRDNLKDRCKIRNKFYSGLKFKNLLGYSGMQ